MEDYSALQRVSDLTTLVGTYSDGFSLVLEAYTGRIPRVHDPVLQLACAGGILCIFVSYIFKSLNL